MCGHCSPWWPEGGAICMGSLDQSLAETVKSAGPVGRKWVTPLHTHTRPMCTAPDRAEPRGVVVGAQLREGSGTWVAGRPALAARPITAERSKLCPWPATVLSGGSQSESESEFSSIREAEKRAGSGHGPCTGCPFPRAATPPLLPLGCGPHPLGSSHRGRPYTCIIYTSIKEEKVIVALFLTQS